MWTPAKVYEVGEVVTVDRPAPEAWWARLLVRLRLKAANPSRRRIDYIVVQTYAQRKDPT